MAGERRRELRWLRATGYGPRPKKSPHVRYPWLAARQRDRLLFWPWLAPLMHPTTIKLRRKSRLLEVQFADATFELPFEYLRVYSPSAEVRGHGPGQETLQLGKHDVQIARIEPIGNYAVRLIFDDGHDTGLYSWTYLHELGTTHAEKWQNYLGRLKDLNIPYPTPAPVQRPSIKPK